MSRRCRYPAAVAIALLLLLMPALPARALIERLYSLQQVMDESKVILECRIDRVDAGKKAAIIDVNSVIKGKTVFKRINVNIGVGQEWNPEALLKHLKPQAPALVFYDLKDKAISCLVYTDGLFFQLFAEQQGNPDRVWWRFTHIERKMNRCYAGPTTDLIQIVRLVNAGKRAAPAPNPKLRNLTREELLRGDGAGAPPVAVAQSKPIFSRAIALGPVGKEARSVSWADYDGDGYYDALVCAGNGIRLYRYSPSHKAFVDVTASVGLHGEARSASWADYNGDGRPDLYVVRSSGRPALWENTGRRFLDRSALLPDLGAWNPEGAGWIDADGDGHPDILLTDGEHGNFLFLNRGSGPKWFSDVSDSWGLGRKGLGVNNGAFLCIADYDGDGLPDFLYNVDHGLLAHNEDGTGFKAARSSRIQYAVDNDLKIGAAFGDFDNDGDVDLVVPQPDKCRLYRNDGNGTFTDTIDRVSDLATLGHARTAAWGDVDGDGLQDLVVGFVDAPLKLFINEGNGRFTELSDGAWPAEVEKSTVNATGLAFADFDGDGRLDLLVAREGAPASVLVNTGPPVKPAHAALRVRLGAAFSPGAIVRVYDAKDRLVGLRQVGFVQNFSSQDAPEAFFGVVPGTYRVAVLLSSAQVEQMTLVVPPGGKLWQVPLKPGKK